jgi:FkbM family methyltransferase
LKSQFTTTNTEVRNDKLFNCFHRSMDFIGAIARQLDVIRQILTTAIPPSTNYFNCADDSVVACCVIDVVTRYRKRKISIKKKKEEMKQYSQNDEEKKILEYFGDFKGTLLDIGANDGQTFSNSLALIERGWSAVLIEPCEAAFDKLSELHADNVEVILVKCAIGETNGLVKLFASGPHLKDNSDVALLSSVKESETERWKRTGVQFQEEEVVLQTFASLQNDLGFPQYDFITIDCEGLDLEVLRQIDLSHTKLVCVEHNGQEPTKQGIIEYCRQFDLDKIIYVSGENIIIGR